MDLSLISSIIGILIDISRLKWAESIQKARVEEAVEAKRQQERFIDVSDIFLLKQPFEPYTDRRG